jgi:hypothetical protein
MVIDPIIMQWKSIEIQFKACTIPSRGLWINK